MQTRERKSPIPSLATWVEWLLSQIWDRFPDKLTHLEEQRLLKDCLFHGCKKSILDSVKYCFANPHVDYIHFLEECHKAEDEDKVGQAKAGPTKAKVAAATIPPTREDKLAKWLKYQQHQIDTFWGRLKTWCQLLKPQGSPPKGLWQTAMGGNPRTHGEEVLGEEVCQHRLTLKPLPNLGPETPSKIRGLAMSLNVGSRGKWDITNVNAPL